MLKNMLSYLWKVPLCALAFYGGTMIGGMVASGLGLPAPEMPAGADQMVIGQIMILVSLILAGCLAILSPKLSGGFVARWLSLSLLIWIAYGVNNILEGAIFTSMSAASVFTIVLYIFASLLCGAAAAWLFPSQNKDADFITHTKSFFARYTTGLWIWRLLGAFLGFPADLPGLWTPDRTLGDRLLSARPVWFIAAELEPDPTNPARTQLSLPDSLFTSVNRLERIKPWPVPDLGPDSLFAGRWVEHASGVLDAHHAAGGPQPGNPG